MEGIFCLPAVCSCVPRYSSLPHTRTHTNIDTQFLLHLHMYAHTHITNHVSCDRRAIVFSDGEKAIFFSRSTLVLISHPIFSHVLRQFVLKCLRSPPVSEEKNTHGGRGWWNFTTSVCAAISCTSLMRWKPSAKHSVTAFNGSLNSLLMSTDVGKYCLFIRVNSDIFLLLLLSRESSLSLRVLLLNGV